MIPNDQIAPLTMTSTAGTQLRAAREALGLSQEAVAQQLKLAPRQVRAIEEDDYARLPGRTFVRGFVRNYARLVHLDQAAVAAGLPRVDGTSPLDRPSLTTVSRPMAEMPVASVRRQSSTRWLIPAVLIAIVAAAGVYEYTRTQSAPRRAAIESSAPEASATAPAGQSTTVLPNPLDNARSEATRSAAVSQKSDGTGVTATAVAPAVDASALPATGSAAATAVAPSAAAVAEATLLLTFKQKSWVEVKDGNGAAIFVQTGAAGTTQTVRGTPPLDLAIGNAVGVGVTFNGQPVDVAAHTRANIARMLLK